MGDLRYKLLISGYILIDLNETELDISSGNKIVYSAPETVIVESPTLLLDGKLNVYEQKVSGRPSRIGRIERGKLILPISKSQATSLVRFEPVEQAVCVSWDESLGWGFLPRDDQSVAELIKGLYEAACSLHWILEMSAISSGLDRLANLLIQVADDLGIQQEDRIWLKGVPDTKELAVLAGVSKESAAINLEWLIHQGILSREDGKLFLHSPERLRELVSRQDENKAE